MFIREQESVVVRISSATWCSGFAASIFLLLGLASLSCPAQTNYTVTWRTTDGGGGVSTGGVFTVRGTIGQPDARGVMSGGNYRAGGGFWGLVSAVLSPGAPPLTVTRSGANVVISWPSVSASWTLQQSTGLPATNWTDVPATPTDNGVVRRLTLPAPAGNCFYRLRKQ
ncbi:MAG: hypothetical protein DME25_00085 [Verrucomicrobia bacterium]|nr:MAG: hypothetical protein DME25_00085 [Verrucomicrobiota bacterium]